MDVVKTMADFIKRYGRSIEHYRGEKQTTIRAFVHPISPSLASAYGDNSPLGIIRHHWHACYILAGSVASPQPGDRIVCSSIPYRIAVAETFHLGDKPFYTYALMEQDHVC